MTANKHHTDKPQKAPRYTKKELDFMRANYKAMTWEQIGEALGRSRSSVEAKAHRMGLRKRKGQRRTWRGERLERLKELYPNTKNAVIADIFGVTVKQVKSTARYYGLRKAPDYVHDGHYKAGHAPHNTHQIGTIIERAGRVAIKVTDDKDNPKDDWVSYQYYLWVSAGNRQPKDNEVLRIKPQYVGLHHSKWTVDHIECVTMAEHLERNSINRYPKELNSAIRLLSRIRKEIENEHQ